MFTKIDIETSPYIQWFCRSYGIWCFGLRLYGDILEQLVYVHLNIKHSRNYSASNIGLLIGLWILVFYITVIVLLGKMTVWVWRECQRIKSSTEYLKLIKTSRSRKLLKELLDFKKSPAPYMEFSFEGMASLPKQWIEV